VILKREFGNSFAEEYYGVAIDIFERSFKKFDDHHASELSYISPRSKANVVRDYAVQFFRDYADSVEEITYFTKKGTTYFVYKQKLLIKIKKLTKKELRASYNHTKSSRLFESQQTEFNMLGYTNVYLGYTLDDIELDLGEVHVVCPGLNGNYWSINLTNMNIQNYELFEIPQEENFKPTKRVRVKKKKEGEKTG